MGRNTYEMTRKNPGPSAEGTRTYVFSNRLNQTDEDDAIVSRDPARTVSQLKQSPGKDIWLFGGGILFRSLLEANLVDTVEVAVIPMLLGGGLPFLPPTDSQAHLKLVENRTYSQTGIVSLKYSIVESA